MVENSRKDPRAKVLSMTVRYKSATLDEFIEHHSHDVSRGGMYIKTPQPFPPGTLLKFEVKIGSDQRVMQGVGRVVWRRQSDEATESHPAGMGVKFIKLDEESKTIIGQVVSARASETSAFDEVAATSERPPPEQSERPPQPSHPGVANFFPTSNDDVPAPAPEDRTVMKQAAELLQEALREVSTTGDTDPPTPRPETPSPAQPGRSATTTPVPGRVSRDLAPPRTAGSGKHAPAVSGNASAASTAPPAAAAASGSVSDSESQQKAQSKVASRIAERSRRRTQASLAIGAAAQPTNAHERAAAVATPADPVGITARKSSGGGARAVIMLLLVAGVAGAVFVLSRKAPPPATPAEPFATASVGAQAPSASAAEEASVAPSVPESPSVVALDEPAPTSTASATASASASAPVASASAGASTPPQQSQPPAQSEAKPRPRPRAVVPKKPSETTATEQQPEVPTETAPAKPVETEAPKPAPTDPPKPPPAETTTGSDTTSGDTQPKPKAGSTPAPAPQTDELL